MSAGDEHFLTRKRLAKLAQDAAAGKLVRTHEFDEASRVRITHALQDASQQYMVAALKRAHAAMLREVGVFRLANGKAPEDDLVLYMQTCDADHFAACAEHLYDALKVEAVGQPDPWGHIETSRWNVKPDKFEHSVNTIMREHRIGYEMVDGRFFPKDWWEIIFNPSFPYRLAHTVSAFYVTTAFVVLGVGAYTLRRG
jgi:hypothetical protein